MTQIELATKDATPQVMGPFHVTFADVGVNYAAGFPLFTPAAGQYILAAWAMVTDDWTGDGFTAQDNFAVSAVISVESGSSGSNGQPGLSAAGAEVRAYLSGGASGYTTGEADLYFIIAPAPTA